MSKKYTRTEAFSETEKMKELVGNSGTRGDYEAAEEIIEEERVKNPEGINKSLERGRVTVVPPERDKHVMIAFQSDDPKEFRLFNEAAEIVTRDYGGFGQVGADNTRGYAAWELWNLPKTVSPYRVVKEIEEKMREYREKGWF